MTRNALRVIAFAYAETKTEPNIKNLSQIKFTVAGISGIKDPIKDKIKDYAIKYPMYYDLVKYVMQLEKENQKLKIILSKVRKDDDLTIDEKITIEELER